MQPTWGDKEFIETFVAKPLIKWPIAKCEIYADRSKTDLGKIVCTRERGVNPSASGSCPVAGFGVSVDELLGSVMRQLITLHPYINSIIEFIGFSKCLKPIQSVISLMTFIFL
jgi:hypothetical protein